MDIYIYGTKGGARPFYQTSQGVAAVFDDCRGFGNGKTLGQIAYSIEYTENGVAFTKWIIVDDAIRDSIGFIAFAVEIKKEKKLKGKEVLDLIDNLLKEYQQNYLVNRYEIGDIREDWSFVNTLKSNYQGKLTNAEYTDSYEKGDEDGAFIYYSSIEELQNYFDVPNQPDYKSYKQVFFVDEKYKGTEENPLKALRHKNDADLTSRKILENLRYRVIIPGAKNGISTKVTKAGITIRNHEYIHPLDSISITFSRENHDDSTIDGTINQLKEKHEDRVKVDSSNRTLTITPPNNLEPISKIIHFTVQHWKAAKNENAKITLLRQGDKEIKPVENNAGTFNGDELSQTWKIRVNGKTEARFVPNESSESRTININEEKIVEFRIFDNSNRAVINNYTLSVNNRNNDSNVEITPDRKSIKFINSAIEKDCIVTISAIGYEVKITEPFFPQETDKPIKVNLNTKKKEKYSINVGAGKNEGNKDVYVFKNEVPDYNESVYKDIVKLIKVPKDKRLKKIPFEIDHLNYTLTVQYEDVPKLYKNWKFLSAVTSVLVIVAIVLNSISSIFASKESEKISDYTTIENYTNGNVLELNQINTYIQKVSSSIPMSEAEPKAKSFFITSIPSKVLSIFKNEKDEQVTENIKWESLLTKLNRVKLIREAVNHGKVNLLQERSKDFIYSEDQNEFKEAVQNIDTLHREKLEYAMKKDEMSTMGTDQIAFFLNNYQKLLNIEKEITNKAKKNQAFLIERKDIIENNLKLEPKNKLSMANRYRDSILKVIEAHLPKENIDVNKEPEEIIKNHNEKNKLIISTDTIKGNQSPKQQSTTSVRQTKSGKAREIEFEDAFWKLMSEDHKNNSEYNDLYNEYNDISSNNEAKKFIHNHLTNARNFDAFKIKLAGIKAIEKNEIVTGKNLDKLKNAVK